MPPHLSFSLAILSSPHCFAFSSSSQNRLSTHAPPTVLSLSWSSQCCLHFLSSSQPLTLSASPWTTPHPHQLLRKNYFHAYTLMTGDGFKWSISCSIPETFKSQTQGILVPVGTNEIQKKKIFGDKWDSLSPNAIHSLLLCLQLLL